MSRAPAKFIASRFPYSIDYLAQIENAALVCDNSVSPKKRKRKKSKGRMSGEIVDSKKITVEESSEVLTAVDSTMGRSFLFFPSEGFCYVTLIRGVVDINGYTLMLHDRKLVLNPSWMPALRVRRTTVTTSRSADLDSLNKNLSAYKTAINSLSGLFPQESMNEILADKSESAIIILEEMDVTNQEWMVVVEDKSLYSSKLNGEASSGDFISLNSAICGTAAALSAAGLNLLRIPTSWSQSIRSIAGHILDESINSNSSSTSLVTSVRALICGAKGTGKSTCLRYAVNRLLSTTQKVCVIDCDIGQPEFSVPGLVSLHVIQDSVLSPSYLNLQTPVLSFFIGDITTKKEPEIVISAVRLLYEKYLEVASMHESAGKRKGNRGSNIFEVLSDPASRRNGILPLLINTDGFIRYMGAELLTAIVSIVKPTYVLHIKTLKDPRLSAIEPLVAEGSGCTVFAIDAGRNSPSKVSAADNRTLRLVAYFLRSSVNLSAKVHYQYHSSHNIDKEGLNRISIKGGVIYDPQGILAHTLMSSGIDDSFTVVAPFETIALSLPSSSLSPALLLASFNASIVGIAPISSRGSSRPVFGQLRQFRLNDNPNTFENEISAISSSSSLSPVTLKSRQEETLFSLDCNFGPAISADTQTQLPCTAIAIVKAIDIKKQRLVIILPPPSLMKPVPLSEKASQPKTVLIRGCMSLPSVLVYSVLSPYFPYLSSEMVGSGASTKSRKMIKRRPHNEHQLI